MEYQVVVCVAFPQKRLPSAQDPPEAILKNPPSLRDTSFNKGGIYSENNVLAELLNLIVRE